MTTGLKHQPSAMVGQPLDFALPGGSSTRGFWTKRKKTALSMLAVLGLIAGVALAFKLFEQEVPNNVVRDASNFDYTIQARDVAAGETAFRPVALTGIDPNQSIFRQDLVFCPAATDCDVNTFPGDSRLSEVLIKNNNLPAKDATFLAYVDNASIKVLRWDGGTSYTDVTGSTEANRYRSFWTLQIAKQTYYVNPLCTGAGGDCNENNPNSSSSYSTVCEGALTSLTRGSACDLGTVRARGSRTGPIAVNNSDDRQYRFTMKEADDGTDQSAFKGWRITFKIVFQARVPATPETSRSSLFPNP